MLEISLRDSGSAEAARLIRAPFAVEHVETPQSAGYDFEWNGSTAYLALHDIVLTDGSMRGDEVAPVRRLDLRRRLTFVPEGARLDGWAQTTARKNSYTTLTIDQRWLLDQLEVPPKHRALAPAIYFEHAPLQRIIEKLAACAVNSEGQPRILAEALTVLAGHELLQKLSDTQTVGGQLGKAQLTAALDFMDARIADDVSLTEIAGAAGLSVFHFSRAFKAATGVTPYRHLLQQRINLAKSALKNTSTPIAEIALQTGFKSASQFSKSFTQIVGATPRAFRAR